MNSEIVQWKEGFWLNCLSLESLPWFQPAWGQGLVFWRLSELLASRKQLSWVRREASSAGISFTQAKTSPISSVSEIPRAFNYYTLQRRWVQQHHLIKSWCIRDDTLMIYGETFYITHTCTHLQFLSNIFPAIFEAKPKFIAENNCCWVALQSGSEILEA